MKTKKPLSELNIKYNEKFNELWNNCDGFNQLNLRDLNNLIVKIIKEIKKEVQEDFKKKVEELKKNQRKVLKERITDLFGGVEKHAMDDALYEVVNMEIDKIFGDFQSQSTKEEFDKKLKEIKK